MKKHLLIGASILALGITTTAIYAQVTGTSVVDKMKAVAHSFTLATTLNPSDSGLTSDPIKGKKTGDILTAGEYNRLLELVSEGGGSGGPELWKCTCGGYMNMVTTQNLTAGETCVFGNGGTASNVQYSSWSCTKLPNTGGGGGAGWVDVPLTDTSDFDRSCLYRFDTIGSGVTKSTDDYLYYANAVSEKSLLWWINLTGEQLYTISSTQKNLLKYDGVGVSGASTPNIIKIEKLCGGGGAAGGGISNVEVVTSQDVGGAAGTSYANRWSEANCPAGKKIISGGCSYPGTRNSFIHNAPKSDLSGWTCGGVAYNGDISSTSAEYPTRPTAYAVCGIYGSSSGASSSWVGVPLTDTASFDQACEYRFQLNLQGVADTSFTGQNPLLYASGVDPSSITYVSHVSQVTHINSATKSILRINGVSTYTVTKIEKRCN